ncbi:RNA 2',3'-cyclic phosphodiesterase [soil metagenome]
MLAGVVATVDALRPERPQLRWARPDQWHLTLAFLGDVAEEAVPDLQRRLERAATRRAGFRLRLAGAGTFGPAVRARLLLLGIGGDREALVRLAAGCSAAARRAGVSVEDRRYRPHLTILRAGQPTDLRHLVERLRPFAGVEWRVDGIRLVRSQLGPVPAYETVGSWPLRTVVAPSGVPAPSGPAGGYQA